MALILALSTIWLAGLLTVSTETFTNLMVGSSWRDLIRGFFLESLLFTATAVGWGALIWVGGWGCQWGITPKELLLGLGLAHVPLWCYPLTIAPSIGYRLEQLLWLSVFLILLVEILSFTQARFGQAVLVLAPGWMAHILLVEWRLVRRRKRQ